MQMMPLSHFPRTLACKLTQATSLGVSTICVIHISSAYQMPWWDVGVLILIGLGGLIYGHCSS